jgi:hypothetical protein
MHFGRDDEDELAGRVTGDRPEAPDTLEPGLAAAAKPAQRHAPWLRHSIALVLTALVLSVTAALGGTTYAAGAVAAVYTSVSNVLSPPSSPPNGGNDNVAKGSNCPGDSDRDYTSGPNNGDDDPDKDGDVDRCG